MRPYHATALGEEPASAFEREARKDFEEENEQQVSERRCMLHALPELTMGLLNISKPFDENELKTKFAHPVVCLLLPSILGSWFLSKKK